MTLSELIHHLQGELKRNGDLKVLVNSHDFITVEDEYYKGEKVIHINNMTIR